MRQSIDDEEDDVEDNINLLSSPDLEECSAEAAEDTCSDRIIRRSTQQAVTMTSEQYMVSAYCIDGGQSNSGASVEGESSAANMSGSISNAAAAQSRSKNSRSTRVNKASKNFCKYTVITNNTLLPLCLYSHGGSSAIDQKWRCRRGM